jgi:magnesium transporter
MRLASLLGPELDDVLGKDPDALRDALSEFHAEDIAELVADLEDERALAVLRALPAEIAADVLERLPVDRQVTIFGDIGRDRAVEVLSEMDPDDAVDVMQGISVVDAEMSMELQASLALTEPEMAEELRVLATYEPETAGGRMTTQYVSLAPETKVWEAIEHVRDIGRQRSAEWLYYVYIVGYGAKLLGVVSLRDLILADPGQILSDLMIEKVIRIGPLDDQERAAELIARYDLHALPVVDEHEVMLGVVTVDDVVDVVIQEATEDAQRMAGVVPLEDSYFAVGMGEMAWKRGAWLVVLFIGQLLTATVLQKNQRVLEAMVELVLFIPLIISAGGNAGSQSSSLIIRALAIGEIRPSDWMRIIVREASMGLILGFGLAMLGFVRAMITGGPNATLGLGLTVSLSILSVVTIASIVGSMLPLLIKRVGLDPAVSSTPFIASVVDVFGLVLYLLAARTILGLAL